MKCLLPSDNCSENRMNGSTLKLHNYKGSLIEQFSKVTGVRGFKLTSLRKAVEAKLQNNPDLASHSKSINYHSQSVGKAIYDEMDTLKRIFILLSCNVSLQVAFEISFFFSHRADITFFAF